METSGKSVSLSSDGKTVAIGAMQSNVNGVNTGKVRIFEYDGNNWIQKGNDINGDTTNNLFGISVSLSANGNVVAIGARDNSANGLNAGQTKVFYYNNSTWTQLGDDIYGENAEDWSGTSVSISKNEKYLAIGAIRNDGNDTIDSNRGNTKIYEYINNNWAQVGSDIDGEEIGDNLGYSVSLNYSGNIVAIGSNLHNSWQGHAQVFQNIGGVWTQLGSNIDGVNIQDQSGNSVSISDDGYTVAIGSHKNDNAVGGQNSGNARVFKYNGMDWAQLGNDINGESTDDRSGHSVSLNSDGSVIAVGAIYNDGNGSNSGHTRVYEFSGTDWVQVYNDIDGENAFDESGHSVSLNSDGTIVAIGAASNDGSYTFDSECGHTRIYGVLPLLIEEKNNKNKFSIFPNPTIGKFNIVAEAIVTVEILNINGEKVYAGKENEIDLSQEPDGIYIIKVITYKQTITRKLIKQ